MQVLAVISAGAVGNPAHTSSSPQCLRSMCYQLKQIAPVEEMFLPKLQLLLLTVLQDQRPSGGSEQVVLWQKGNFPAKSLRAARLRELLSAGRQPPSRVVVEVHAGSFGGQHKPGRGPSCRLCVFPTTAPGCPGKDQRLRVGFSSLKLQGKCFPRECRRGWHLPNSEAEQPRKL